MLSEDWQSHLEPGRLLNMESSSHKETTADSGFQDKTVFESSLQVDEIENIIEELPKQPTLQPRRLFMSSPLEDAAEQITEALNEDEEPEEELSADIRDAFNSFKSQLKVHFSNRYKKIEAKSQQSLIDCQKNVTSLLETVHNQRLLHLEKFQNTVVCQLECLEQDCLHLKTIEKETLIFWQTESDTVRAFCDGQQKRLDSILIPPESTEASFDRSERSGARITAFSSPQEQSPMDAFAEITTADPS